MNVTVVLAVREKLTRWQAARYRVQSHLEGRLRPGLASVAAVAVFAFAVAALLVILGLVP